MIKNKTCIVFAGPTGVGKSDLAVALASKIPSEIINADVGQLYEPLTIGTAKPDWKSSSIQQHFFDRLNQPEDFTALRYHDEVVQQMESIWRANKVPIIVGGSTFYIHSLFFPPIQPPENICVPDIDNADQEYSWDALAAVDPARAQKIHPHDIYRIKRALAILQATGKQASLYEPVCKPPSAFWFYTVARDRAQLYCAINARVIQMFDQGWLEEVDALRGTAWEPFLYRKKIIGYDLILDFLNNPNAMEKEELIEAIAKKTRNYAKRQIGYFKMLQKKLEECLVHQDSEIKNSSRIATINLTLLDHDLYIEQLSKEVKAHILG